VLGVAVVFWHSKLGTLLLYGAAIVHVALAFDAIYARRTLRMPPGELLRIFLGVTMPILLIGHAVGTRMAFELYELAPAYHRVVWSLWSSDSQGRQLALLAPGWIHGCMGLHYAFCRRAWYRRYSLVLFAIALVLPVLSAAGFISMMRELAGPGSEPIRMRLNEALPSRDEAAAIGGLRNAALTTYLSAIGLVFLARAVRAWVERRRKRLIAIRYPSRMVRIPYGWSVLEASRAFGVPHASMCGGRARCSTCRVRIAGGAEHCPSPTRQEQATLTRIGAGADVRLGCQLRPSADVALAPLVPVREAFVDRLAPPPAVERELVVLDVSLRDGDAAMSRALPQDALFQLERFNAEIDGAIRKHSGTLIQSGQREWIALFGLREPLEAAVRASIEVVSAITTRSDASGSISASVLACIDVGTTAIREPAGAAPGTSILAAGAPIERTRRMREAVRIEPAMTLALSEDAVRHGRLSPNGGRRLDQPLAVWLGTPRSALALEPSASCDRSG
jgi:adenylate cyclase